MCHAGYAQADTIPAKALHGVDILLVESTLRQLLHQMALWHAWADVLEDAAS